jgi:hypothetical protein
MAVLDWHSVDMTVAGGGIDENIWKSSVISMDMTDCQIILARIEVSSN